MQDIVPTIAQHYDVVVPAFEKYLRARGMYGSEEVVSHGLNDTQNAGLSTMDCPYRHGRHGPAMQCLRSQRNFRPSPRSRSSHLFTLQNKTAERPAPSPYSHHVATERIEECTPVYTAASSIGALPTPSGFWQQYSLPPSDMGRKTKGIQKTHTIRAQLHWHGLCHVTQTAVAPRSCRSKCKCGSSRTAATRSSCNGAHVSRIKGGDPINPHALSEKKQAGFLSNCK